MSIAGEPGFIRSLEESFKPGSPAMQKVVARVAALMTGRTQRAFDDQGRPSGTWDPRHVPNLAGIISDLRRSPNIASRRFQSRPAGIDTGALRNSIFAETGPSWVEYGSRLDYASKFQKGDGGTIEIDRVVKKNLTKILKSKPELRPLLGFLFNKDSITTAPPARPFVEFTDEDKEAVRQIVKEETMERGEDG